MRLALLLTAASLTAAVASFACSGSKTETGSEEPQVTATDKNETTDDDTSSSATTNLGTSDASTVDVTTIPLDTDAGSLCEADSVREAEPNDTAETATKLEFKTTSLCGRVADDEEDWFTFTIPATGNFSFNVNVASRGVDIICEVDGREFDFRDRWPAVRSTPYHCRITPFNGDTDYRFEFTVTPR